MSVAKSGRQRGVAKQLHAALLAHAQQQQLKGVFLSTSNLQVVCVLPRWPGLTARRAVCDALAKGVAKAGAGRLQEGEKQRG